MIEIEGVAHEKFVFSGGELQVSLKTIRTPLDVVVRAGIFCAEDIVELALVVDALRRHGARTLRLVCPYLPYARQDRVMLPGQSHSLRVMCDFINALRFDSVEIWDVHSDVALGLLNNVVHYGPETFLQRLPVAAANCVLVAPDAGAAKKVYKVGAFVSAAHCAGAETSRCH